MKIIYDNKGRVTEVIGSSENGTLTEQEFDLFKFTLKCRSDEETKLFAKTPTSSNSLNA